MIFKRRLIAMLVISVLFLGAATGADTVWAAGKKTAEEIAAEKAAKERLDAQEAMKKLVKAAKEKLNGTSWQIAMVQNLSSAASGAKGKKLSSSAMDSDTLNFSSNKISSSAMSSNGFTPTNYTVRVKGKKNEITIWETMQTSADKGVAFWRGEVDADDNMRGVLSWQIDEKNKQDYSFTSSKKSITAPKAAPAEIPQAAPKPLPDSAIQPPQIDTIANSAVAAMAATTTIVEEKKAASENAAPVVAEEEKAADQAPKTTKKNWW
jgi:hypothetical protein